MRILARCSGGKAFVSNSASSNNRTRIRILSHTQGSFHSTVLLIVRERERPLESKWKRRNKRSGPAATVGLFVENKMMRGFTKDAGLAKKWVERIGSSSDSVGAARECVTKGGETNSSSAVSVGPGGQEQFPELRHHRRNREFPTKPKSCQPAFGTRANSDSLVAIKDD